MVTPELVSYIWSRRKEGMSDIIIKANLRTQGWTNEDFEEAAATLPPPHTKVDGPMISQLGPNVVWTGEDNPKSGVHARKWKILGWGVVIGLMFGVVVWLVLHPEAMKGTVMFIGDFIADLARRSQIITEKIMTRF